MLNQAGVEEDTLHQKLLGEAKDNLPQLLGAR
jgi:hypothetical protein